MIRRDAYLEAGGYDESIVHGHEDWDFWLNLAEKGCGDIPYLNTLPGTVLGTTREFGKPLATVKPPTFFASGSSASTRVCASASHILNL